MNTITQELHMPPMWTHESSLMEAESVKMPFLDPVYELGDETSFIITQCRCLSNYTENKGGSSEEEKELVGEDKDEPAGKERFHRLDLLHALWKIH